MTASIPVVVTAEEKHIDFVVQFHWRGKRFPTFTPTPKASKMLNAFDGWKLKDEKETDRIAKFLWVYTK